MEQASGRRTQKRVPVDKPTSKPPRYEHSEAEKIRAVTAMMTTNREHPLSTVALEAGYKALGHRVHHQTLSDWHKQYRETVIASLVLPTTSEIVQGTRNEILDDLHDVVRGGLSHAKKPETIAKATYYQAVMGAAVGLTKINEITGLPQDVVRAWQDYEHTCSLLTLDAMQSFLDFHTWLKSQLPTVASIARDAQQDRLDSTTDNTPTEPVK
jgi:hypothetical protein